MRFGGIFDDLRGNDPGLMRMSPAKSPTFHHRETRDSAGTWVILHQLKVGWEIPGYTTQLKPGRNHLWSYRSKGRLQAPEVTFRHRKLRLAVQA